MFLLARSSPRTRLLIAIPFVVFGPVIAFVGSLASGVILTVAGLALVARCVVDLRRSHP